MKRALAYVVILAVLCGPANGMMVDTPLEIVTAKAELIVTGKVTSAAVPAEFERLLPDINRPVKAWYTEYQVTVNRVIKSASGIKVRKGDQIVIAARAAPPRGPGLIMVDGPSYPNLKKGSAYVLLLRRLPGKEKGYYLPAYFKNFRPDRKQDVDPIVKAAQVDRWAWGKAVNGLQFAMATTRDWAQLGRQVVRRRVGGKWVQMPPSVHVRCVMALRNRSKKPMTVSLYPGDKFLSVDAINKAGKKVHVDFYAYLETRKLAPFDPAKNTLRVEPGKIVFISSYGTGVYGMGFNFAAPAGKWTLRAKYSAQRKENGLDLWLGESVSGPVDFEVKPARKR